MEPENKTSITKKGIAVVLSLLVIEKELYKLKHVLAIPHHLNANEFALPVLDFSFIGYNIRKRQVFTLNDYDNFCQKRKHHSSDFICRNVEFRVYTANDCVLFDIKLS